MKKKELIRRFVTNILYAGLEQGDVGFLKKNYNELKLYDKIRISEMRIKWNKVSSKAANAVYEDIIGIIVEEICQKGNRELLDDLMEYYLKRFPDIQKSTEDFGDDIEGQLEYQLGIYPSVQGKDGNDGGHRISVNNENSPESVSDYTDFQKSNLVLLYAITACKENGTEAYTYIKKFQEQMRGNYKDKRFLFYDRQRKIVDRIQWVKNKKGNSYFDSRSQLFTKDMKRRFSEMFKIEPEKVEEWILDTILCMGGELQEHDNTLYNLNPMGIWEMMGSICKKFHMNSLEFSDSANRQTYIGTIKELFEEWCRNEMGNSGFEYYNGLETGPCEMNKANLVRCGTEVAASFLFQCYAESQQGIWDEYYKNFSFDNNAEVMEELYEKCSRLNDENIQYRNKLQSYEEADSLRKKQQNKKTKESDRQYMEKIALLEKQIREQAMLQENMNEYIRLVEGDRGKKIKVDETDYSKIYGHKIVFVGGVPEAESRLKAVFSKSEFINDENVPIPKKTDLIVLLAGNGNRSLYYKCLETARKLHIKVIYCAADDVKTAAAMVSDSL